MTPAEKLQKLQDILKLVDESISRKEFTEAFAALTKYVKDIKDKNTVEFEEIKDKIKSLTQALQNENQSEIADIRNQVQLVLGGQIEAIEAKLKTIKDGARGPMGERGFPGLDGKDGRDGKDGKDGAPGKDGATGRALVGWGAHPLVIQNASVIKEKVARNINVENLTVTRSGSGVITMEIPIQTSAPTNPFLNQLWIDTS